MADNFLNLSEVERLMKAEHETTLLKRLLAEKLRSYSGIPREELENICTMLGVTREGDSE